MATNEVQSVNAQGVALPKPDFTDPLAIKMDSAKKMSIADKTGNEALKREAAAEQSFADRMGGRSALVKPKQPKVEGQTSPQTSRTRNIGMLKSASQPVLASEAKSPAGMVKSQSTFKVSFPQIPTTTEAQVPLEAITLKLDAAAKQSLADRTGDIRLKQAAAAEQSLADRLGSAAASRLNLAALSRSVLPAPTSPVASAAPAPAPVHVPLPLPVAVPLQVSPRSATASSVPLHTCSCCGHQEPFNGNASGVPVQKKERSEGNWRAAGTSDTGFGRKRMEKSASVSSVFANKPAPIPNRSDLPGKWAKSTPKRDDVTPTASDSALSAADALKKNGQRRNSQQNSKKNRSSPSMVTSASSETVPAIKLEKEESPVAKVLSEAGTPGM